MSIVIRHQPSAEIYGKIAYGSGKHKRKKLQEERDFQKEMRILDTTERLRYLMESEKIKKLQDYYSSSGIRLLPAKPTGNIGFSPLYGGSSNISSYGDGPPVYPPYGRR